MIAKLLLWTTLYPIAVVSFFFTWLWNMVVFLFNSPVDIWMLISDAVDGELEEQ